MGRVVLTREMIEAGKSSRGGWSNKQVQQLGLPSLEGQKGWQERLVGTEVEAERYQRFLDLTDAHISPAKLDKAQARAEAKLRPSFRVRMDPEDYAIVARIAVKRGRPLPELAYRALVEYFRNRNITLKGLPDWPPLPAQPPALHAQVASTGGSVPEPAPRPSTALVDPAQVARAGTPWTDEETALVCSDFVEGVPIVDIAIRRRRSEAGIVWRLRSVAAKDHEIDQMLRNLGH